MISRPFSIPMLAFGLGALAAMPCAGQTVADLARANAASASTNGSTTGQPARADQAKSVVRRYNLADLLPGLDDKDWTQTLFVAPGMPLDWLDDGSADALSRNPLVDLDSASDLLSQALGDDLRFEGRGLSVSENGELLLLAPLEVQDKAKAILEGLGQALGAHALVTVDVLNLEGGDLPFPDQAVVTDEEAGRLVALMQGRGAARVHHELSVTPGNTAVSDLTHQVPIIGDYDVEIAQLSGIWDPIRAVVEVGQQISLRGTPMGDGVEVAGMMRFSDLVGKVKDRPLQLSFLTINEKSGLKYGPGPQVLQQAEVAEQGYAFSGKVGGGKALVCASELTVGGVRRMQVAVIRATEVSGQGVSVTELSPSGRALVVINREFFSPPRVDAWSDSEAFDFLMPSAMPFLFGRFKSEMPPILEEMLSFQFNLLRDMGPWALIVTDPAWDRAGVGDLTSLEADWPSTPETVSVALQLSANGTGAATPAQGLVPARMGQESAILVGTAMNVIWDYDVEVAHGAALADPVMDFRFSGIGAILGTGGGSSPSLEATILARIPSEAPVVIDVGAQEYSFFDRQYHDLLRVRELKNLGPDGSVSFGGQASGAKAQSLEVHASLR